MVSFLGRGRGGGGREQKSSILDLQKCEFCAEIQINLQSQKSGFGVSRTMEGRPSPKNPLLFCRDVPAHHRSTDSACVLEKMGNEKRAYFHKSWGGGRLRGERLS